VADSLKERIAKLSGRVLPPDDLNLGYIVQHGQLRLDQPVSLPHRRRPEHLAILGKTGTGKSSLLQHLCEQDIRASRSFVFFDLHGDATPMLARLVAAEEERRGQDLSERFVIFDPADRKQSIGINILKPEDELQRYVQIAEVTEILRSRWKLEVFGARTEELLRNSLQVLQDNQLTLIDIVPLLTNRAFRLACVGRTTSPEAVLYFSSRYNRLSEAAQAEYREAVLNKVTVFASDPHFRHVLGQEPSTVSLKEVMEGGFWMVLNLDKGRLGEQATTLGSLLLTCLRHALFARDSRELLTLYCDEFQNLVSLEQVDTILAEARKLGISVASANQYLDQYPEGMQAAVLSVGTLLFFQLSGFDANRIASALGGGWDLAHQLRSLPSRQLIARLGRGPTQHIGVPEVLSPQTESAGLISRSNARFARPRVQIEEAIAQREASAKTSNKSLDEWD
jgi:Type IV secretion-system coupling protein DNA-binding domain